LRGFSVRLPWSSRLSLFFDSSFGSGIYNHVFLSSISPRGVNSDLILPTRNTAHFRVDSVDYGPESIWKPEWNFCGIG
jgi:hypothetical protein